MRLPCGRSWVWFPARIGTKTFKAVGNLLATSVSAWLSKDRGSILLSTRYEGKKNITTFLYKRFTR